MLYNVDDLRAQAEKNLQGRHVQIDRARLSPASQLSYDVFIRSKREQADWLQPDMRALTAVRPFNHFGGLHVEFSSLMSSEGAMRYDSESDYRDALLLDTAFGKVLDNAILAIEIEGRSKKEARRCNRLSTLVISK